MPAIVTPCRSCLPLDCFGVNAYALYSLEQPPFLFVIDCPSGFDCSAAQFISLSCCGDETLVDLTGMIGEQRARAINDAVQQCLRSSQFCGDTGGGGNGDDPGGGGRTPIVFYASAPQTCCVQCADGNPFCYPVAAGTFVDLNLATANARAQQFACQQASRSKICLGNLPANACVNVAATWTITSSGLAGTGSDFWSINSGAIPTGMTFNGGYRSDGIATITGTPTAQGAFTFAVRVATPSGAYMTKSYTVCIVGMTPASLPNATNGTFYDEILTPAACSPEPIVFELTGGALPIGLSLNGTTGTISGTPNDVAGVFNFTVTMHSGTLNCSKAYALTLNPAPVTNLTAYWTLESEDPMTNDFLDSVASLHLAALGVVPAVVPAKIGNGVMFQAAFGGTGWEATDASLKHTLATGFSMFGWFKINVQGPGNIAGGPGCEYTFTAGGISVLIGDNTKPQPLRILTNADSADVNVSLAAWHFFHVFYDPVQQKYGYAIDGGAKTYLPTVTNPGTTAQGTVTLAPAWTDVTGEVVYDEIGIIVDAMLTDPQVAYLYNAGAGRTWPIVLP